MKKQIKYLLVFVSILSILIFVFGFSGLIVTQKVIPSFSLITPPTSIQLNNGKFYWLSTLSIDSANEELTFNYIIGDNVKTQTLSDGTQIQPKTGFNVGFSVNKNQCEYSLQQRIEDRIFPYEDMTYYEVIGTPSRNIIYNVKLSKTGETKIFSAFDSTSKTFNDIDGKGSLVVKSLGSLQGQKDCPEGNNVLVCIDKTNTVRYFDRAQYGDGSGVYSFSSDKCKDLGTDTSYSEEKFILNFKSTIFTGSNLYTGVMPDNSLGTAVITATADQDIFDSVIYTPPVVPRPIISSISVGTLVATKIGTINVVINNQNDDIGFITVKPTGQSTSFIPQQQQTNLDKTTYVNFAVTTPSIQKTGEQICVQACSQGNQFVSGSCDSKCITTNIAPSTIEGSCGNNICETNKGESYTTCSKDCPQIIDCTLIPNSKLDIQTNNCMCNDNYEMTYDTNNGKYYCKKSEKNLTWVWILVGGFGVSGIIYAMRRKK